MREQFSSDEFRKYITKQIYVDKIWLWDSVSHDCEYEDYSFVRCDTVQIVGLSEALEDTAAAIYSAEYIVITFQRMLIFREW